jgi:hypothetical protein
VKQINVMAFQLKFRGSMKMYHVFHVSLLQLYHVPTISRRIHDSPPPIEVDGEHEYEVEDILNSRIFNSQFQYFVHWHGYDVKECTWKPIKNLLNAMEKVHEFHRRYPNNASLFLMEFITRRGGDVTDANIKHHLPMDRTHP